MNSSQGPGANGEGPSEWVERALTLSQECCEAWANFKIRENERNWVASESASDALRTHLKSKEAELENALTERDNAEHLCGKYLTALESREAEFQLLEKDITEFREAIAIANERMDQQEALLEKERKSRKEAQMENARLKDHLARHGIEARTVLAKRDDITKQLAGALNSFLYEFGDKSNISSTVINARAALAAYQEKT